MQRLFEWLGHPSWEIRGTKLTHYVGTCKDFLSNEDIPPDKSEALDLPAILEHVNIVWVIRTSLLRNQRHWTHPLCWEIQRLFKWSGHPSWEIRSTELTVYVGTCKGCLSDQDIPPEKSEALHSPSMLGHAKVVWVIKTSLLKSQRHCTHQLCWNMQKVVWVIRTSLLREIKSTALTNYVGTCKDCLSNQDIPPEKSEALDSQTMLEYAKVFWVIKTSLLRNQRNWTHILCWDMQRLFEWSVHPSWEIRDTALTRYFGTAKVVWVIRTSLLRNQRHWTHQLCWNVPQLFKWSGHPSWEIRGTKLTHYIGTCKDFLSNKDIPPDKSEALDSPAILEHVKVVWVISTSFLRNQRHWTYFLCWDMQRLFEWSKHPSWEIRGTALTA